ncbi:SabA family sialic acid-binding adhesin [Helicobacter pylori]|uniref:outer membrane protein n=1 Tax=Helicobacter pylori TaxID=210 RepID=UPI0019319C6E|nr:SabA family sialic acid-binding adhesin [Helicobacter pylori]MBM0604552.1 outer membrane beta-barrel protein [Helicobacter pylori]MBM0614238.1 outer membrane beta-barrel protein [Helicobacter pylori]MBM0616482.1 outer membrane beta-barrel protein [Helicobacter pylori]MBM0617960.1 outer membrane beta-barrel protein [Helicobacter pylori]MBM0629675.1 outer membrane beta-barrel protein [Helicobacter pylori]
MKKTKKTILLSLTLASSLLHAEDNGVFLSVGYQIGEAVQKVKNADKVQKLSDAYENLNKLLAHHGHSNPEAINASSATAINQAINNLNKSAQTLVDKTDNSPAYQATLLALKSTVGLWNSIAYAVICGGYTDKPNHNTTETFYNQPGQGSNSITCGSNGLGTLPAGKNSHLSIEQFATLNKAYQIIQAALKQGLPALSNTKTTVEVTIKTGTNAQNINVNNDNNNAADTTVSITDTFINDAQNLLTQAQTIINTLQDNCPMLKGKSSSNSGTNGANTPSWQTSANQNSCSVFGTEFSAISSMISNAQNIVQETQQLNANQPKNITQPNNFNLNSPNSVALAQSMLKNAQSQTEILKLANQVGSDFNKISTGVLKNYIEECSANASSESVSNDTWGKGCAGVKNTLASLESSNASFSSQTPQINQAQTLANAIVQELGHNPFKQVGMISSQTNNGAMNGLGVQAGYKQFFGEKRRWGLRYYGFFDYNHTYIKSSFFNSASDVWTYGVGSDLLFNFINDKNTNFLGKNNKISVGLFGGIALAGTSWLNSQFVNLKTISNVYSAKVNTANFQFLFNLGLRTNLARPKKKDSHHAAQHGMELGVKIPTINTNYYSFLDTKLEYRRLYSVYLNYVFAY